MKARVLPLLVFFVCTQASALATRELYQNYTPFTFITTQERGAGGVRNAYFSGLNRCFTNPASLYMGDIKELWGVSAAAEGAFGLNTNLLGDIFSKKQIKETQMKSFVDSVLFSAPPVLSTNGPLQFGKVDKGFGYFIYNRSYIDNIITYDHLDGLYRLNVHYRSALNNDIAGAVGKSFSLLDLDNHKLYLGVNAKVFMRYSHNLFEQLYQCEDENVLAKMDDYMNVESNRYSEVREKFLAGGGLGGAVLYKYRFITFSLVLEDGLSGGGVFFLDDTGGNKFFLFFPRLNAGLAVDVSFLRVFNLIITCDYNDLLYGIFLYNSIETSLLNFNAGAELVINKKFFVRAGFGALSPAAGFGIAFEKFKINFALYGRQFAAVRSYNYRTFGLELGVSFER